MLAGSGNYIKELAKPVTFCSFVEIRRTDCTLCRLATASSSHKNQCVWGTWRGGVWWWAYFAHHSSEVLNLNNIFVGQVISCPLERMLALLTFQIHWKKSHVKYLATHWWGRKGTDSDVRCVSLRLWSDSQGESTNCLFSAVGWSSPLLEMFHLYEETFLRAGAPTLLCCIHTPSECQNYQVSYSV